MEDTVTYIDLKFVSGATVQRQTEVDDIMYENVDGLQPPRETLKRGPLPVPTLENKFQPMTWLHKWCLPLCLVFSLLCLTLLAGVIVLAVKYVQMSSDLQHTVTNYHTMTQRLQQSESLLASVRKELLAIRTEQEKTIQANMGLNNSLHQCQQDVQTYTVTKQAAEAKLDELEKGLCPEGWLLFGKKCLWFSKDTETWEESKRKCESQNSNLLVVQWDDQVLKDFISKKQEDFWVGKEFNPISWSKAWWKWPDQYQDPSWSQNVWKISWGELRLAEGHMKNSWICEKNVVLTSLTIDHYTHPSFTLYKTKYNCYKGQ